MAWEIEAIERIGFSAVAFLMMYWMVRDQNKTIRDILGKQADMIVGLRLAIDAQARAVDDLRDAINELKEKLSRGGI